MDGDVWLIWVDKVWKPFCRSKLGATYLLMDEFTVHQTGTALDAVVECGSEIDFIPAGYTSKLQVLDVGLNKPFKGYVKDCYEEFMVANEDGVVIRRLDVARWVDLAWAKVTVTSILNTWNKVGLKSSY